MIATAVYLLDLLRRALKRTNRTLALFADAFDEARERSRAAQRKYPFAGE